MALFFVLLLHFLSFVLPSPCPSPSLINAITATDLLSSPSPFHEAKSRAYSVTPASSFPPPQTSANAATMAIIPHAAEATVCRMPSITTQHPSSFNHDQQSSWRSVDITNVLLGALTTIGSLLALGVMYYFRPLYVRRRQSGKSQIKT